MLALALLAASYTPEPDAGASAAQRQLYDRFRPHLPSLSAASHPEGSVRVYIFPGAKDRTSCDDNTQPLYWTWYSTVHLVPILSGFASNSCGMRGICTNETRYTGSFYECFLSGVDTNSYTNSGFDRGHMVNSHALAKDYGGDCQTFNMCNIAPQSPQMNRKDWYALESLTQALGEGADLFVLQGSLLGSKAAAGGERREQQGDEERCVCGKEETGTAPCSKVAALGCNSGDWQIRVPYEGGHTS